MAIAGRHARLGTGLAVVGLIAGASSVVASRQLSREDRAAACHAPPMDVYSDMLYADAIVRGPTSLFSPFAVNGNVAVLVATTLGRTSQVAAQVDAWQGQVDFRDDRVGYLRVQIPATRWPDFRCLRDVLASRLDGGTALLQWIDRENEWKRGVPLTPRAERTAPTSPPAEESPKPLLPVEVARRPPFNADDLTGTAQFRSAHPTYDGRGLTIGLVEMSAANLAADHQAFGPAYDRDGRPILKIPEFLVASPDWRLVRRTSTIVSHETLVRVEDSTYKLPRAGRFSLGLLQIGHQSYPVLWDPQTTETWVDATQSHDFTGREPVRDVRQQRQVGHFEGAVTWPSGRFFVTHASDRESLLVHPVSSAHATMTASVAAGAEVEGNLAVGVAPGARIIPVDAADDAHGYIEGVILAARHPAIDIISVSQMAARNTPNADRQLVALIVNRIVTEYDKLVIGGADNSFAPELVDPPGSMAVSVGAYLPSAVARAYFDLVLPTPDVVWPYSARGPAADGSSKPDLIGPVERIAAIPCDRTVRTIHAYRLPECYAVAGGTSAATPAVAGLAALLLSGARQSGITVHAADLRNLLRATARFLPGVPVSAQGAGLPQITQAWQRLTTDHQRIEIVATTKSAHRLIEYEPDPDAAQGIYEPTGWWVGRRDSRTLTFVRQTGPERPIEYRLAWKGNDGTFNAPATVTLRRGEPTSLRIRLEPRTVGVHTALLALQDPSSGDIVDEREVAVTVPDRLTLNGKSSMRYQGSLQPWERRDYVFNVPPGVDALKIAARGSGRMYAKVYEPAGWLYHRTHVMQTVSAFPAGSREFVLPNPEPGTWRLVVAPAFDAKALQPPEYEMGLALSAVDAMPRIAINAGTVSLDLKWTTEGAASSTCTATAEIGSQQSVESMFEQVPGPQVFSIPVESGTNGFVVRAHAVEGSLSLHLYNCASGTCLRYETATPAAVDQAIRVAAPQLGIWKVAVTPGPSTPQGSRFILESIKATGRLDPVPTAVSAAPSKQSCGRLFTGQMSSNLSGAPVLLLDFSEGASPGGIDGSGEPSRGRLIPIGRILPLKVSVSDTAARASDSDSHTRSQKAFEREPH